MSGTRSSRACGSSPWAEEDSSTWSATSADVCVSASPVGRTSEIAGWCWSIVATPSAAGPLSRTRRPLIPLWPLLSICAPCEAAGDLRLRVAVVREAASEERMERLDARLAVPRARGRPQDEVPGRVLERPEHRLALLVGHDERGRAGRRAGDAAALRAGRRFQHEQVLEDGACGDSVDPADRVLGVGHDVDVIAVLDRPREQLVRIAGHDDDALLAGEAGE